MKPLGNSFAVILLVTVAAIATNTLAYRRQRRRGNVIPNGCVRRNKNIENELDNACLDCFAYGPNNMYINHGKLERCRNNCYENVQFWECLEFRNKNRTQYAQLVNKLKRSREYKLKYELGECRYQIHYCTYKVEEKCNFNERCFQNYVKEVRKNENDRLKELLARYIVTGRTPEAVVQLGHMLLDLHTFYNNSIFETDKIWDRNNCFEPLTLNILWAKKDIRRLSYRDMLCSVADAHLYGYQLNL